MDNTVLAIQALESTVKLYGDAGIGLLIALIFAASWRWHL